MCHCSPIEHMAGSPGNIGALGLYVEGAVSRPYVAYSQQHHVHEGPHPQPAEAEELADALLPVAEVEPVKPVPGRC